MTRSVPLPEALRAGPFSFADARSLGVSLSRLRAGDLEAPTRGSRVLRAPDIEDSAGRKDSTEGEETPSKRMQRLKDEMIATAHAFAPALSDGQFYSHGTGLGLVGVPLPYTNDEKLGLHVAARRPSAQPQRSGVIGHRLQKRKPDRWEAKGLPVEHPARMWRQAASSWMLDDLIAAGDFLVNPRNHLLTIDDLWREVEETGDVHGLLRRALLEIREGAESAPETRLRLAITRAGLPEPELNWNLRDKNGVFIARLDLAYPQHRVAPEYDGRWHAEGDQFAKDADRWDAIRIEQWQHVRVLSHHLYPDAQPAVDKVTQALLAAGWLPGQP